MAAYIYPCSTLAQNETKAYNLFQLFHYQRRNMLDEFSALVALAENGTMCRAAVKLHITQSAVSKRIKKLETELKHTLVEPSGRNVELTPYAMQLLTRISPLISEIRHAIVIDKSEAEGNVSMSITQVVLLAWGAEIMSKVQKDIPNVSFNISCSFGYEAIEEVRSGNTMFAIAYGYGARTSDLKSQAICEETVVLIPSSLRPFKIKKSMTIPLISVPASSEESKLVHSLLTKIYSPMNVSFKKVSSYRSSAACVQMAKAGFGNYITSLPFALSMGIKAKQLVFFPDNMVKKTVYVIARPTTFFRPIVQNVIESIKKHANKHLTC